MDCKTLAKFLIAGLTLTLLLMAMSGCVPQSETKENFSEFSKAEDTFSINTSDPSTEGVPSEIHFGSGDYGKKEELSDVDP